MDLSTVKVEHLPKKTKCFECDNWNFYVSEDNVITFTTYRDVDQQKLLELHNEEWAIEKELTHVRDEFTREDLLSQLSAIRKQIKFEQAEEYEQPYSVEVTDEQYYQWIKYAKKARKDSVRSVAYATWCVLDFGETTEIVYNPQSFPREWICDKKGS